MFQCTTSYTVTPTKAHNILFHLFTTVKHIAVAYIEAIDSHILTFLSLRVIYLFIKIYKIQDGFIAFSCIQLYTYKTLFTNRHAQVHY